LPGALAVNARDKSRASSVDLPGGEKRLTRVAEGKKVGKSREEKRRFAAELERGRGLVPGKSVQRKKVLGERSGGGATRSDY